MKLLFILFFLALINLSPLSASADTLRQRETDLSEGLLDLAAQFDNGITRQEFRTNLSSLNVKFDRYTRSGGDRYGTLYDAIYEYRKASVEWDEHAKSGALNEPKLASLHAQFARKALDRYRAEKSESKSKTATQSKKPLARKTADSELEKALKKIDEDFKIEKEALDRQYQRDRRNIPSK